MNRSGPATKTPSNYRTGNGKNGDLHNAVHLMSPTQRRKDYIKARDLLPLPFNQFKPISLLLSFFVSNDPLKMTKDINDVG